LASSRCIFSEKATHNYQQEFRKIGMEIPGSLNHEEWIEIYRRLTHWEIELESSDDQGIAQVLNMQRDEANKVFEKFIVKNYIGWLSGDSADRPVLSPMLFKDKVFPLMDKYSPLFVLIIDNLRFDQWKAIQPLMEEYYRTEKEELYYSILPTTTQYARNSIFSGLMPLEIERRFPEYWVHESDDAPKNQFESELLSEQLKRFGRNVKHSYHKVLNLDAGRRLVDSLPNLLQNDLNVIVYNFVDMLSHARTEMEIIRELADDEPAYRSLMLSWFEHSSLFDIIKYLSEKNIHLLITTDHGSVLVNNAVKIIGDRNTNTNLRYKTGRNLNYNPKEVFDVRTPHDIYLPKTNVSSTYVFCSGNDFFAYPNNYNHYVKYYKNTFQHGGISMEEVLIPVVSLGPK
jgi:hypothetical protein